MLANTLGWPWRQKKKEGQDYATKRFRLATETGRKKKSKTGEDGSYQMAGDGDGRRKKSKTEKDGSYHTDLRLALETEEERRAKNGLDLIWI